MCGFEGKHCNDLLRVAGWAGAGGVQRAGPAGGAGQQRGWPGQHVLPHPDPGDAGPGTKTHHQGRNKISSATSPALLVVVVRVGQAGDWVCSLAGECEADQDSGYRDTEDNFIGRRKRQTDRRCKAKFNLNTLNGLL